MPLLITNDRRGEYIAALEEADAGDLQALITLFADVQITHLENAIDTLVEVEELALIEEPTFIEEPTTFDNAIEALGKSIELRNLAQIKATNNSNYIKELIVIINAYIKKKKDKVSNTLYSISSAYEVWVAAQGDIHSDVILKEIYGKTPILGTKLYIKEKRLHSLLYAMVPILNGKIVKIELYAHGYEDDIIGQGREINIKKIGKSSYHFTTNELDKEKLHEWLEQVSVLGINELHKRIAHL